jgi:hypothetical protein
MNESSKQVETVSSRRDEPSAEAPPPAAPAGEADPMAPYLAHASALLHLGPADALRVVAMMSEAIATKARAQGGSPEAAEAWSTSSESIAALAASLGKQASKHDGGEVEDDEEDLDDETEETDEEDGDDAGDEDDGEGEAPTERAAPDDVSVVGVVPAPRKPRVKGRRSVAGLFDVTARVESCRLREVNEMGERGELVGRVNEQGIEQNEWPIATMTAERLRRLTQRRGGKYMFEWLGRNEKGARVALGRSRVFKVQGEKAKATPPPVLPVAAAPAVASNGFEQFFAMQKYQDERRDLEEARRERTSARQTELLKLRERLAAKERMHKLTVEARLAKAQAEAAADAAEAQASAEPAYSTARLDEDAVAACIERKVSEGLRALAPTRAEGKVPTWLQEFGVNEQMFATAKPLITEQLLPFLMSKLNAVPAPAAAAATPTTSPTAVATPYPNVTRIVPKGGGG